MPFPDKLFDLCGWIIPFIYGLFMLAGLLLIPSLFAGIYIIPLVIIALDGIIVFCIKRATGSLSKNPLNDILIYRLYGLTAVFGLSWIRPLTGLFITILCRMGNKFQVSRNS